jgi:hypothetical protein
MTRARRGIVAGLAAALLSLPVAAGAIGLPESVVAIGANTAIEGGAGDGGATLAISLSLLWPVEDRFRVGVMGFSDDLGDRIGRLRDSQGQDLGPVSLLHRGAWGAAWRMEAHRPTGGRYGLHAVTTWGVYRVEEDLRGATIRRNNAAGIGIGLGASRAIAATHSAGITVNYRQLWRSVTQRYLTAAVEWRWHRSAGE